jgi:hypothetical protein
MTRVTSALSLAALAATGLASSACSDPLPSVPLRTYAYAVFVAQPDQSAASGYVLRSSAFFFKTNQLNPLQSGNAPDLCQNRAYAPPPTGVSDTLPAVSYLDAGSSLALETAGGTTASLLAQTDAYGKKFYAPAENAAISPFTPGEVVTVTVPGGSGTGAFPATVLTERTVEPFTFTEVATDTNEPNGGLKLTWTPGDTSGTEPPAGTAPTGMLISLRYALVGTGAANRELFCSVRDDGEFIVDQDVAAPWFNSLTNGHEVVFTRWRGELSTLQAGNFYKQTISSLSITQPATTPPASIAR